MRSWTEEDILYIHGDDIPNYKKQGSIVRNSFFWALRSIAGQAAMGKAWEFEGEVWFALQRMLMNFTDSGYLGTRETQLEFREDDIIPKQLQAISTWISAAEFDADLESSSVPGDGRDRPAELADENRRQGKSASTFNRSAWRRKTEQSSTPETRPRPPYSSYIKKS